MKTRAPHNLLLIATLACALAACEQMGSNGRMPSSPDTSNDPMDDRNPTPITMSPAYTIEVTAAPARAVRGAVVTVTVEIREDDGEPVALEAVVLYFIDDEENVIYQHEDTKATLDDGEASWTINTNAQLGPFTAVPWPADIYRLNVSSGLHGDVKTSFTLTEEPENGKAWWKFWEFPVD